MTSRNVLLTALLSWFVIFSSCNNDDNNVAITSIPDKQEEPKVTPEEEVGANTPPSNFELIGLTDKAVKVGVHPTFSWEASQDQEGDIVLYDLYLDSNESPSTLYAADLSDTHFEVTERLYVNEKYAWKVVAKDSTGETFESEIFNFDTRGLRARRLNEHADFKERLWHTSLVFDEKIWVLGGNSDSGRYNNDVWASTDGLGWSEATLNYQPPFSGRREHASAVFDDKMWITGGVTNNGRVNDIWASDNGLTWSEVTPSAPFSWRSGHTLVPFDNRLWFIGGWEPGGTGIVKNDVWYSNDGSTWTEAISEAPFVARTWHKAVTFENKIWVIGGMQYDGESLNDVWFSSDGITWSLATATAPFSERFFHSAVVFDSKMWVIGGGPDGNYGNDIWYSKDGVDWEQAIPENSFPGRSGHTSVIFNDQIWLIGGDSEDGRRNDVWILD